MGDMPKVKKSRTRGGKAKQPMSAAELKMKEKLKEVDHELKVWIGNLKPTITAKALEKHFAAAGCKPTLSTIMRKGAACVVLPSEGDVASAIGALNGTALQGQNIEVDVWTKPEKKE